MKAYVAAAAMADALSNSYYGAGSTVPGFTPDLRKTETRLNLSLLVKM